MQSKKHTISKSSFLKFEQCPKAFFLNRHFPQLRDRLSTDKQLTFKRGNEIGLLAQSLFPGGSDLSSLVKNNLEGIEETQRRIEAKDAVLYEASFVFENTLAIADIVVRTDSGYEIYEVKSSLRVSETYIKDACLQYYVISQNIPVKDFFLVTLNPDYRLQEVLEVKKLFKRRSVLQKAKENFDYFRHQLTEAKKLLDPEAFPNVSIGPHCMRPYQCDYFGHCWKPALSAANIFEMPMVSREKVFDWFQKGIRQISDLTITELERENLMKVRNAIVKKEAIVDPLEIRKFLAGLQQPALMFDMEVYSPAVPCLKGTGPFAQIPFLASFSDQSASQSFFVESPSNDHLRAFAEQLIKYTAPVSCLLVYDKNLEQQVLQSLAERFPDLRALLDVMKAKMLDLSEVFKRLHYYHPNFKGSFSLKTVVSVLAPEFRYEGISTGLEAMQEYETYIKEHNPIERLLLKDKLIQYCEADTRAGHLLLEFLQKI